MTGRLLLTGAAGFLGGHVLNRLRADGIQVTCAARPGGGARMAAAIGSAAPGVEIVEGSLSDHGDCRRLLDGCSTVVHLAAAKTGHASGLFAGSVTPTRVLAGAAAASGITRFVHVSSLGVYAPPARRGLALTEASPVEPSPELRDPYTFSKVAQERVVMDAAAASGLPVVIVRPGVIYGPGSSYMTPRVGLGAGGFFCVMGGKHRLPYTFVTNCADAIVRAACTSGIDGEVFNVIDDELPTGRDLVAFADRHGRRARTIRIPSAVVPLMASTYEWCASKVPGLLPTAVTNYRARAQWTPVRYSNAKAKAQLNWQPLVPLADALRACGAA